MADKLTAYRIRKGKRVATYRVVMVAPFLPESQLPDREPCDICRRPARRFDSWGVYCDAHWPTELNGALARITRPRARLVDEWQVEGS